MIILEHFIYNSLLLELITYLLLNNLPELTNL